MLTEAHQDMLLWQPTAAHNCKSTQVGCLHTRRKWMHQLPAARLAALDWQALDSSSSRPTCSPASCWLALAAWCSLHC